MDKALSEALKHIGSYRFYNLADNRVFGIQPSRIDPAMIFVFTCRKKVLNPLFNQAHEQAMFSELFRWDQRLIIFNF